MRKIDRPQARWTSGLAHLMRDEETGQSIDQTLCHLHLEVHERYVQAARAAGHALARFEMRGPSGFCVLSVPSARSPSRLILDLGGHESLAALRAVAGMGLVRLVLSDEAHGPLVEGPAATTVQIIGLEGCLLVAQALPPLQPDELIRVVNELTEEAAHEDPGHKTPWVQLAPQFPGLRECGFIGH